MRPYITIYLFCMLFSLNLFAEEIIEEPEKSETTKKNQLKEKNLSPLATLIEKIKTSKSEDRRELMNKLKIELRAMNRDKRQKTMRELKKSFSRDRDNQQRNRHRQQHQPRHQPQYLQLHRGGGEGGGRK